MNSASPPDLPRVLVLRHPEVQRDFYRVIEDWIHQYEPQYEGLLDVRDLPLALPEGASRGRPYGAMVPWLQDPVQHWSPETYDQTQVLQAQCDALAIPVLNRVENLTNAGKSRGAMLMGATGVRVPKMALITDPEEFHATLLGVPLPLFVREDWGHGKIAWSVTTPAEARATPLERFERPVAVEWVDTSGADGLFRKYRYFAAGDAGISHHLQCSAHWMTRGHNREVTELTRAQELAYVEHPDPHHAIFQAARKALGLDMVAFDYALGRDGRPVIWEANAFPFIQFSTGKLTYRNSALHRTMYAILRLYLRSAGLSVDPRIEDIVAYRPVDGWPRPY